MKSIYRFVVLSLVLSLVLGKTPQFDVPIVNVTVIVGQTAVLPCSIDYLGKYKVAWLDHNTSPLTYEDRRVVDDARFSIVRPYIKEWNLQIRDVAWTDQGQYLCAINTSPVKYKTVMLHVKGHAPDTVCTNDEITDIQEGCEKHMFMPEEDEMPETHDEQCRFSGRQYQNMFNCILDDVSAACSNQYGAMEEMIKRAKKHILSQSNCGEDMFDEGI